MTLHGNYKSKRKNRIFYTWLFSYVIILLIPILSSIIISFYTNNVVNTQLTLNNETLSHFVMEEYDELVSENLKVSAMLIASDTAAEFFNMKNPLSAHDKIRLYNNYRLIQPYYTQFYNSNSKTSLYFYSSNCDIIAGDHKNCSFVMSAYDAFVSMYNTGGNYDNWKQLLESSQTPVYLQLGDNLLYIMPYYNESTRLGAFVIDRKNTVFNAYLPDTLTKTPLNMEYAIFDTSLNAIYSSAAFNGINVKELYKGTENNELVSIGKSKYKLHQNTSTKTGLSYIVGVSDSESERLLVTLHITEMLMIAIPFIICFYLIWFITKRNYIPLEQVLEEIRPFAQDKISFTSNGFELLKNIVKNIVTQNAQMNEKFNRHSHELRNNMLHQLLIGYNNYTDISGELADGYDIKFAGSHFAVVVFHIEAYEALFRDAENMSESKKLNMIQFIFTNAFEELANKEHSGYVINSGGKPVLIVSFDESKLANAEQWLYDTVSYLKTFISENFSVYFTASVSNIHSYINGISVAYTEALKALDYKSVMESNTIITQSGIKSARTDTNVYAYSSNTEQLLISYINTANLTKTHELISTLLESTTSADMRRLLVYNLAGTLIKLLENTNIENRNVYIDALTAFETIDAVKETLLSVTDILCENKKEYKSHKLDMKVKELVENEYSNPELSIGYIADRLGLHNVYLSSAFKAHTGEGLLEYINNVRIEHSVSLLKDEQLSIESVSSKVGYSTSKTFIRTFKKLKGITPAKYRDSNK